MHARQPVLSALLGCLDGDLLPFGLFLCHSFRIDLNDGAIGRSGNVEVRSHLLRILGGSEISDGTIGRGDGGSISIDTGTLVIDSRDSAIPGGVLYAFFKDKRDAREMAAFEADFS